MFSRSSLCSLALFFRPPSHLTAPFSGSIMRKYQEQQGKRPMQARLRENL